MRSSVMLILICAAGVSSAAQNTPTAATATVEGVILAADTGIPLNKAWVVLRKTGRQPQAVNTRTDASGKFVFTNIEPGRYNLFAARNGYVRQEYGQSRPDRPGTALSLAPGQVVRDIEFRMIRAAVVTGHVYDEDGEPAMMVMMNVMRRRYVRGKRELVPTGTDISNDLGEYRIFNVAPGEYSVSATPMPGFASGMMVAGTTARPVGGSGEEEGYSPTFYPGTLDSSQATPLQVRAGEVVAAIDFSLMSSRAVRLRGRVVNAVTGEPARGAFVRIFRRDSSLRFSGPGNATSVEDPQGAFELSGVTPGAYNLEARRSENQKLYTARMDLDVGTSDIEGITLVIAPGVDVSGTVLVEGRGELDFQSLRVQLQPKERGISMGFAGSRVKPDSSFVLSNVSPGDFRLTLTGLPDDCYLKSARMGGYDVLDEGITIMPGRVAEEIELVISSRGGHIEGAVLDDDQQPVQAATVVLIPDPPRRDQTRLYVTATTDQYGRYTLRGITPGSYKIFAWQEIEYGAYQDPEFIAKYETEGESVRIQEGDRQLAQLQVITSDEM